MMHLFDGHLLCSFCLEPDKTVHCCSFDLFVLSSLLQD